MMKIDNSKGEVSMRMKTTKTPKSSGWLAKVSRALVFTIVLSSFTYQGWIGPKTADAMPLVKKGTIVKNTATGAQAVTGVGFQPKAVVFWWTRQNTFNANNAGISTGYGFAANSATITQGSVAAAARDNLTTTDNNFMESTTYSIVILNPGAASTPMVARASVTAFGADGFTLNWQTNEAQANQIHYMAIGGSEITNATVGTFTASAAGAAAVAGVGFTPDAVLFVAGNRTGATWDAVIAEGVQTIGFMSSATSRASIGWSARDAQTALANGHAWSGAQAITGLRRGGTIDQAADFTSMDADGFTLNFTTLGGATNYIYLAIKGGFHKMGTFNKNTATGAQSVAGVGFQPAGLMLLSESDNVAAGTARSNANPASNLSIGATDGTTSGSTWMHYQSNTTTDTNTFTYNTNIMKMGINANGTVTDYGNATFTSFGADGFTINWTTSDATARNLIYWAIGGDATPPTAGTVTVSPDAGGFISSAPTITTVFTDNESAVTSCEYTTDGAAWVAGAVSGASPTYTCTGSPTGLTGAVTINMRATSAGGLGTATAINRTVDTTGPTDGTLTVTAGLEQNALSWTAASDAGSGVKNYNVRYLTGATPPTCATGTSAYTGTGTSFTHTALSGNMQYSYRVCAYDNLNNVSTGATGSGTPKWASSSTSCGTCHGYTTTFNDGTARNTPAGQFQGSHNSHVVQYGKTCNTCHTTPASGTGADYNHRNSTIQMATNINGDAGGAYGKGASWAQTNAPTAFTACSNVYCHSQGTGKTSETGDTRNLSLPLATLNWGDAGVCTSCHNAPPNYANGATTWGAAKANSHGNVGNHQNVDCSKCHNATTNDGVSITGPAQHGNKTYNISGGNGSTIGSYAFAVGGGTCNNISCHNSSNATWGSTITDDCVSCHQVTLTINAGPLKGTGKARRAVSLEFNNTWSHKRSAATSGTVTKEDCIVCHMEGTKATGKTNPTYHGNGIIELRDPDSGATIKGVTFSGTPGSYTATATDATFAQFSRDLTKTLETDPNFGTIAAIQVNLCLHCHDSNGATNVDAQVPGGSATKPFATTIAGAGYTGAGVTAGGVTGAVTDIAAAFATTNSSYHPVRGKQNNWYAKLTRMVAPWNTATRGGTADTTSWGDLISCWDCHALPTDSGTITGTVTAHGAAQTLRGTATVILTPSSTNAVTLCSKCHDKYSNLADTANYSHGADSAFSGNTGRSTKLPFLQYGCNMCHSSGYDTAVVRPVRAMDVHGVNTLPAVSNGVALSGRWSTGADKRPYAFIRNTSYLGTHDPASISGTTYTPQCDMSGTAAAGNGTCTNQGLKALSIGGTY